MAFEVGSLGQCTFGVLPLVSSLQKTTTFAFEVGSLGYCTFGTLAMVSLVHKIITSTMNLNARFFLINKSFLV
jgi:hypothetical protein